VGKSLTLANFWQRFATDWVCLDAELLPWSAKAQELLRQQYAATGAAASMSLRASIRALEQVADGVDRARLLASLMTRERLVIRYANAYRRYCWPVQDLQGIRMAPFHLLAAERRVFDDETHLWHMQTLAELCHHDPDLFLTTPHRTVDLTDASSQSAAIDWWTELTRAGGEGMVVKPMQWVVQGKQGLVQPAIKCRGPEYLRIIYGPEYDLEPNIERLRKRGLSAKRALAIREYALGLEALHRFVEHEPLYRVHECVFGVLALESEPVDPRL
jgi:protein phosphatase